MLKTALVSAFALATIGCLSETSGGIGVTQSFAQESVVQETTGSVGGVVVTEAKISRLKRALRLTAAQEAHWHPVEASLRRLIHGARQEGVVQPVRAKVNGVNPAALQQVAESAGPLIASLDEQQKQDGMRVIRELGIPAQ